MFYSVIQKNLVRVFIVFFIIFQLIFEMKNVLTIASI